jgi:hypothetical protein
MVDKDVQHGLRRGRLGGGIIGQHVITHLQRADRLFPIWGRDLGVGPERVAA